MHPFTSPLADTFLADIRENPDEDAPRLIFADWLDDNGDPDRAEFIRVQCQQARLAPNHPRTRTLNDRAAELLQAHKHRWVPALAERQGVYTVFRRGLLEYLGGDALTDEDLRSLAGNRELCQLSVHGEGISDAGLTHLLSLPRLERVCFGGTGATDATLRLLARHPRLRMLFATAAPGAITDRGLRHLHRAPRLLAISFADEENNEILSEQALAKWYALRARRWRALPPAEQRRDALYFLDHFSDYPQTRQGDQVKRIYLQQCSFCDRDMEFLTAVPEVEEIELYQTRINGSGLHYLARLRHLRSLKLKDCSSLAELSGIKGLTQLQELHIERYSSLTDETIAPLETLTGLRSLKLAGEALSEASLHHLEKMPLLESLELFDFAPITTTGMRSLVGLKHLRSLDFWGQAQLQRDGLEVLATMRQLDSFRAIHGFRPELTRQGLALLGQLTNLKVLDLGSYWHAPLPSGDLVNLRGLTALEWLALPRMPDLPPETAEQIGQWFPHAAVAVGEVILSPASINPVFVRRAIESASIEVPEGWEATQWELVDVEGTESIFQGVLQERGFRHASVSYAGQQMCRVYVACRTLQPGADLRVGHVKTAQGLSFHSAEPCEPSVRDVPGADEALSWSYASYGSMFAHRDFVWRRGTRCYALYCMVAQSRLNALEPLLLHMAESFRFEQKGEVRAMASR